MITTRDVKLKETKDEKLTMLTTGKVKPVEFVIEGKGKPREKQIITTSNVNQYQEDLIKERKKYEAKMKADAKKVKKLATKKAKELAQKEKERLDMVAKEKAKKKA